MYDTDMKDENEPFTVTPSRTTPKSYPRISRYSVHNLTAADETALGGCNGSDSDTVNLLKMFWPIWAGLQRNRFGRLSPYSFLSQVRRSAEKGAAFLIKASRTEPRPEIPDRFATERHWHRPFSPEKTLFSNPGGADYLHRNCQMSPASLKPS